MTGALPTNGFKLLLKDRWDRAFRAAIQYHAEVARRAGKDRRTYAALTLQEIAQYQALVYFVDAAQDVIMSRAADLRVLERDARKALDV